MCHVQNQAAIGCINSESVNIPIARCSNVFIHKYGYNEGCLPVEKGRDFGFTIVFGNYGDSPTTKTITDVLNVNGATIKVMSLCTCGYKLFIQGSSTPIGVGDTFSQGSYNIIVKTSSCNTDIPLPPHCVYCISILFQA